MRKEVVCYNTLNNERKYTRETKNMAIEAKEVLALYVGTFNRAADADGLAYWIADALDTQELQAIAFFESEEAQMLYPPSLSAAELVNAIYNNLFNRDADEAGLDYWVTQLESGSFSRSEMLLAIMNGALGNDAEILANKIEVGAYYAESGLNMEDPYGVMAEVTAEESSVIEVEAKIDGIFRSTLSFSGGVSVIDDDVGTLPESDTFGVSAVMGEDRWSEDLITFSFDALPPESYLGVEEGADGDLYDRYVPLDENGRNAVRSVLAGIESLTDLHFEEVESDGIIRASLTAMDLDTVGYAYFPDESWDVGGDLFLSEYYFTEASGDEMLGFEPGGEGYGTIVHELGHALGLEHTFEGVVLPSAYDDVFHSVMSYTQPDYAYVDEDGDGWYEVLEPQLYSLYDVAALQVMYGVNLETHQGDDIYTVTYESHDVITIWDAGGHDLIDLSQTEGVSYIDLHGGTLNSADQQRNEAYYTGEHNLSIAYGVLIEDLKTGSGNDKVTDNEVDNIIETGAGDDMIYLGKGGIDSIDGGEGKDTIFIDLFPDEFEIRERPAERYALYAEGVEFSFDNVELIGLADGQVYNVVDLLV